MAEEVLRYSLGRCADQAILLTDRSLGGAGEEDSGQKAYVLPAHRSDPFDRSYEGKQKEVNDFAILAEKLKEKGVAHPEEITDELTEKLIEECKGTLPAKAYAEHREEQPNHVLISDLDICNQECRTSYEIPCLTFCPAGVYKMIDGKLKAANPSNCLHCKCCQRKCPYQNVQWTVPEGGGGPRYERM